MDDIERLKREAEMLGRTVTRVEEKLNACITKGDLVRLFTESWIKAIYCRDWFNGRLDMVRSVGRDQDYLLWLLKREDMAYNQKTYVDSLRAMILREVYKLHHNYCEHHLEPRLSPLELNLVHKIVTRVVSEDNDEDMIDRVIVFFMLKFIPEYMKQTLGQTFDTLTAYERLELDDTDIPEFSAP